MSSIFHRTGKRVADCYFIILFWIVLNIPSAVSLVSEHHAHLCSDVPQWTQQSRPPVPPQAGRADADPSYLESYAQRVPQPGGGPSQREAGLDGGVYRTSHHDGPAHPRGEQVREKKRKAPVCHFLLVATMQKVSLDSFSLNSSSLTQKNKILFFILLHQHFF